LTIFNTTINFEDFEQQQTGADVVLGHALSEDNRTRGYLRYSWASRSIDQDDDFQAAAVIFRELIQNELTSSLVGLQVSSDTRDNRLSPTTGYTFGSSFEFAGLGFFSRFLRTEASAAWYLGAPWWMPEKSTFVLSGRIGYILPLNDISDYDLGDLAVIPTSDGNLLPLQAIDEDLTLPLSERYFLGGLGEFQLRGFEARSVGPRRALLYEDPRNSGQFIPLGREVVCDGPLGSCPPGSLVVTTKCTDAPGVLGDENGDCNDISDEDIDDFEDLGETDVIGGNKFITASLEYRFPISETLGLQGLVFFDTGNAFYEGENLFDVLEWRYGTGVGVQWFSPFGPLAVILGFPLDPLEDEDSPVFEFSVGGQGF
jgi:outer membrane protein assembly factor BamA